jgi:peroxiredoxin Q/BCP
MAIQVDEPVPDFSATCADGHTLRLSDFRGQKVVVLFFYPADDTLICTKEACAFRDSYEAFVEAGAEVIGISGDSDASHQAFAGKHHLPFHLISDADGSLRRLFGVPRSLLGLMPGRTTYVIDKQGIVRLVYTAALASQGHVEQALAAVKGT